MLPEQDQSHTCEYNLSFLSLNTCGIISKLNCPEFISLIQNYDIIGVQETKTDDYDTVTIPGYKVFLKNRSCTSKNRSGGIALLIKDHLVPFLKVYEHNSSDLVLPFSLSKVLSRNNINEDLHCGVVYIPPYGSRYSSEDPFLEVQETVFNCFQNSNNIILFGDFNSRSSDLEDIVQLDRCISEQNGLEDLYNENLNILNHFHLNDMPLVRKTADRNINMYGRYLLDFSKNNNIFILNGRAGTDYSNPKLTCKERSTVDYFLSSATVFKYINTFEVHEFSSLFSDAHCPVSMSITVNLASQLPKQKTQEKVKKPILWKTEHLESYVDNFDILKLSEIECKMDDIIESNNITDNSINEIVHSINNLYESCAHETFGFKNQNRQINTLILNHGSTEIVLMPGTFSIKREKCTINIKMTIIKSVKDRK